MRSLEEHSGRVEMKPKLDTGRPSSRYSSPTPSSGGSVRLNTKQPRVLSAGDELRLGGTILKFMVV
jgi:hypothetical protein